MCFCHPLCLISRSCASKGATPPRPHLHHGPLDAGAFPQLHDRLNHGAAHVAAGENLPGLKHGVAGEEGNRRLQERTDERREAKEEAEFCPETEFTFSLVWSSLRRRLDVVLSLKPKQLVLDLYLYSEKLLCSHIQKEGSQNGGRAKLLKVGGLWEFCPRKLSKWPLTSQQVPWAVLMG